MRVMLDTMVWIDLKEDKGFLEEFRQLYRQNDLEIVFSHGNFLDLVRRDNQDDLAIIINEFTNEYLGPFNTEPEGEYKFSENPLVLATIDDSWYEYCRQTTANINDVETLKAMFRDGDFDAGPASSVLGEFVSTLRELEEIEPGDRMKIPDDVSQSEAIKKAGIFAKYAKPGPNGLYKLDDTDVPLKKYILGMSLIYISETYHNPEEGDYRDAVIWSQALSCDCDILWTEIKWTYEHPIISQVLSRLNRKNLDTVKDFDGFKNVLR